MIIVTGAAGFIGSCLIGRLNAANFNAIVAVDKFDVPQKNINLEGKKIMHAIDRDDFFNWLDQNNEEVEFIFHIGASTNSVELNVDILRKLNTDFSKMIWDKCIIYQIPLVYAASAATYGHKEKRFHDDENKISILKPLNPNAESKNEFDKWALIQDKKPFFWIGLKFFDVYGPNEYHKGEMASLIFHAFHQIRDSGRLNLLRSHDLAYKDEELMRDYIYVKDVVEACVFLMHHRRHSGIYCLGSGVASTDLDLARAVFSAMEIQEKIRFIDTRIDIREKYQYFTEVNMDKLKSIGFGHQMYSLEDGVRDYVQNYLMPGRYY